MAGLGYHPLCRVNPEQVGVRPALSSRAQQSPGSATDIQDGARLETCWDGIQSKTVDITKEKALRKGILVVTGAAFEGLNILCITLNGYYYFLLNFPLYRWKSPNSRKEPVSHAVGIFWIAWQFLEQGAIFQCGS